MFCCVVAGEWWWTPLLEEMQVEGSCVQADSWSLVVEPSFLQTLHKDLIKQQDVIYGGSQQILPSVTFFTSGNDGYLGKKKQTFRLKY